MSAAPPTPPPAQRYVVLASYTPGLNPYECLKVAHHLLPVHTVNQVDVVCPRGTRVLVHTTSQTYLATGNDAVMIVMCLKPSALEGVRRRGWRRHSWALHNLVGHPLMQLLAWAGFGRAAVRLPDATVPQPVPEPEPHP